MNSSGNYGWGLPVQASTFAPTIDLGIYIIHCAMFVIFILWSSFFTYLLIRYRKREGVKAEHRHGGVLKSLLPDAIILAFEVGLVVLYAIPTWSKIKMTSPAPEDSQVVEVTGEQFSWSIHYPGPDGKFGRRDPKLINFTNVLGLDPTDLTAKDDIVTVNEMHIPLGKPTAIALTSKDVIHSFFVPEFRIKQDAVPGMKISVWFEPTKEGKFEIACAQLCGFGHSLMHADLYVHSSEQYEQWLSAQAPALPLTAK